MQQRILLTLLAGLSFHVSFGQYKNVLIDSTGDPEETSVFINPRNNRQIVAGANPFFAYQSDNGGHTWEKKKLTSRYGVWSDPCIIADTSGNFYYFHLSSPSAAIGNFVDRIVCQKSTDGGESWNEGTYTGLNGKRTQDKPWGAVNPKTNALYVTWSQFDRYRSQNPCDSSVILFSKSEDEGETWSAPQRVSCVGGDCTDGYSSTEGAVPTVGPNGEIYVVWARNDSIWFNHSENDGDTWQPKETLLATQPGGWDFNVPGIYRCNGLPILRCDLSNGPNHGTIYANWSDQRNGNHDTDIWLAKSSDGGDTWSTPQRVNDDSAGHQQFFCWMDLDQTNGNLYFIFYDRRNYSDLNTDVYMAYSGDGGNSFVNRKISESPINPKQSVFFGDYLNIAASNNKIVPIWTRMDGEKTSVWTAMIDLPALVESQTSLNSDHYVLHHSFNNALSPTTEIDVHINEPGYYSMIIYDQRGTEVADVFINDYYRTGLHSIMVNTGYYHLNDINNNSYYYILQRGDEEVETNKLVVARNKP